jgi:hypothetical protein
MIHYVMSFLFIMGLVCAAWWACRIYDDWKSGPHS